MFNSNEPIDLSDFDNGDDGGDGSDGDDGDGGDGDNIPITNILRPDIKKTDIMKADKNR